MALQTVPGYISQAGYLHSAELMRNLSEALFNRTGVIRYGDFSVTPTATTRQVAINSGSAFLNGVENASQGGYFCWSEASQTMLFAVPSASARIDTLLMRVADPQYGTIPGSPGAYFEIVQGTPNVSPVAPADSLFNVGGANYVPGAWWRVADVRTNVGDTTIPVGQITPTFQYVRTPGGMTLCTSTNRPAAPVIGDRCYEIDTDTYIRYDGTNWHILAPKAIGSGKLASTTAFISAETTIMSMTNKTVRNGRRYEVSFMAQGNCTSNTDQYNFRVRQGTALTGTIVAEWAWNWRVNPSDNSFGFWQFFDIAADAVNTSFHLSFYRAAGGGTMALYGTGTVGASAATSWQITERDFTAVA